MTIGVVTLKMVSVKEFRDHATQHLNPSLSCVGLLLLAFFGLGMSPCCPPEIVKKAMYGRLAHQLQEQMEQSDVSEEEVLADFEAYRKDRH